MSSQAASRSAGCLQARSAVSVLADAFAAQSATPNTWSPRRRLCLQLPWVQVHIQNRGTGKAQQPPWVLQGLQTATTS